MTLSAKQQAEIDAVMKLPPLPEILEFGSYGDLYTAEQMHEYAHAAIAQLCAKPDSFQTRVAPWMQECFGPEISADQVERNHRFFEEATELVQACDCSVSELHQLIDYVYGRPIGEKRQEVGGVMVTLAALCLAQDIDMHDAGEVELARIWTKVPQIRAKQAAKPKHSPLPEAKPDSAEQVQIEYQYTGGTHWCDLGPAEKIKEDFEGIYRLKAGKYPVAAPLNIAQQSPIPTNTAAFKNFHRSLCERFGYVHDAEFWWRDQVSLEEHIASQLKQSQEENACLSAKVKALIALSNGQTFELKDIAGMAEAVIEADDLRDRLLVALERASYSETALRNLVDECNNDDRPGWEDRMQKCIDHANNSLAGIDAQIAEKGKS